jgi:hypothetical protein
MQKSIMAVGKQPESNVENGQKDVAAIAAAVVALCNFFYH